MTGTITRSLQIVVGFGLIVAMGCTGSDNFGWGRPIIFPNAARLGDTVAMAIDSTYIPQNYFQLETHSLTRDRVSIAVYDADPTETPAPSPIDTWTSEVSAVFDAGPTHISEFVFDTLGTEDPSPGAALTVAVIDLPASVPGFSAPGTLWLALRVDGVIEEVVSNRIEITGTGGTPMPFNSRYAPVDLEPKPMLRIMGIQVSSAGAGDGFETSWDVGAIEFTLEYPSASLSAPRAVSVTGAFNSIAWTGNDTGSEVKVMLTEPRGWPALDLLEGPFVDVVFDKAPGTQFAAGDFTVKDLRIFDRDGVPLEAPSAPGEVNSDFLELIPRRNQPEGV